MHATFVQLKVKINSVVADGYISKLKFTLTLGHGIIVSQHKVSMATYISSYCN